MPKFIIERHIPGVGGLSQADHQQAAQKSNEVIQALGSHIQWVESFVTGDRIYGIYIAPDADSLQKHAEQSGFPANRISVVKLIVDPTTAEVE